MTPTVSTERRRLILGPIPSDFDPSRDVALGPWCFCDREALYPAWEDLPFQEPFPTPDAAKAADDAVAGLANHWVRRLSLELDARHGVSRSYDFWHLVLMRWCIELLSVCWYRYRQIELFVARHEGEAFTAAVLPSEVEWSFRTFQDFTVRGVRAVKFATWVLSETLRTLAPPGIVLEPLAPDSLPEPPPFQAIPPASNSAARLRRRVGRALRPERCVIGLAMSEFTPLMKARGVLAQQALAAWLAVMPRKIDIRGPSVHLGAGESTTEFPAPFLAMVESMIRKTLPLSCTTEFSRYDRSARGGRVSPGRLRVLVPGITLDEETRFRLAHAVDGGEGLVFVQHGSNYGTSRAYSLGSEIEYRYHAFITWGWRSQGDYGGRFVPLPSPHLSALRHRHRERDATLLLVGTGLLLTSARTNSIGELFVKQRQRRDKVRFLESLGPELRARTVYRPLRALPGSALDREYFSARFPEVPHCLEDFDRALYGCRLLVIDHPGTTLYTALVADVPVVAYWIEEGFDLAPEVVPHFLRLKEAGIVHASPESAAAHAAAIWNDVPGWWRSVPVREAAASFRDALARTSPWWWWEWMKAFGRM